MGDMSTNEIVSGNIRAEAARAGLNQSDIARRLGLATTTISRRWWGTRPWTLDLVDEVAAVLRIEPSDLLRARRDSNPQPADPEDGAQPTLPLAA